MRTVVVTAIGSFSLTLSSRHVRKWESGVVGCDIYPKEWIADSQKLWKATFIRFLWLWIKRQWEGFDGNLLEREGAGFFPLTDVQIDALWIPGILGKGSHCAYRVRMHFPLPG